MSNEYKEGNNTMVQLRNFNEWDISILKQYKYQNKSIEEIKDMITQWNTREYCGKYFEMFAICVDEKVVVGFVSLYQHEDYSISAGPEIFLPYRQKGYGYEAITLAYDYAKKKGYKSASIQIRADNTASIRLHEKYGFLRDCEMINKKGNAVYVYSKIIE